MGDLPLNGDFQQNSHVDRGQHQPDQDAGLTQARAAELLRQYGPNEVSERRENRLLAFARNLWAPVPWMLEAAIALTLALGKRDDAVIISFLLLFNAAVSFWQQSRVENALALLRKRLAISARVKRDGQWRLVPARELVPGDIVHVRAGNRRLGPKRGQSAPEAL